MIGRASESKLEFSSVAVVGNTKVDVPSRMKLCKRKVDEEDGCWVSLADRLSIKGSSGSGSGSR